MKALITLIILSALSDTVSANNISWENVGKLKDSKLEVQLLEPAKAWASSRFNSADDVIRFEYTISKSDSDYLVRVTPVFKGEVVEIDGEHCFLVSASSQLLRSKQCMAP